VTKGKGKEIYLEAQSNWLSDWAWKKELSASTFSEETEGGSSRGEKKNLPINWGKKRRR